MSADQKTKPEPKPSAELRTVVMFEGTVAPPPPPRKPVPQRLFELEARQKPAPTPPATASLALFATSSPPAPPPRPVQLSIALAGDQLFMPGCDPAGTSRSNPGAARR